MLFYLFTLFAGTLFFIPAIFVSRFTTAPALWMQVGIIIGISSFVFLKRTQIFLPSYGFLFLVLILTLYYLWRARWHIEAIVSATLYCSTLLLFYQFFNDKINRNKLFNAYTVSAVLLCIWCAGQLAGWLPSYHNTLIITGPFDNPAGISAALSLLLPFVLYGTGNNNRRVRTIHIIISITIAAFVLIAGARAAIIAVAVTGCTHVIGWVKKQTEAKLSVVHYSLIAVAGILLFTGLYYVKKDSANGRVLIWKCSGQLITQKPVFGFGKNGFTANYMNRQAKYFTENPDNKYMMLADNIRHPFNEYIKITVEYGVAGLILAALILFYPLYHSRKNKSRELSAVRLSLLAVAICATFSYPLNYPFVRLMTVMLLAFLLAHNEDGRMIIVNNNLVKGIVLAISLGILGSTTFQVFCEREWHTIAHRSLRGGTLRMLSRYKALYKHLRHNDLFLYNYAAELNVVGHYDESLQIAYECNALWANYDLQMLMADNCLQLQQYDKTERCLKKAAAMCPVKFMPLYRLAELYVKNGRKEEARIWAQKIVDKEVKIPSPVIHSIKNSMRKLLNEPDSLNGIPQTNKSGMKPEIITSRQDCLSEHQTPRALLPT